MHHTSRAAWVFLIAMGLTGCMKHEADTWVTPPATGPAAGTQPPAAQAPATLEGALDGIYYRVYSAYDTTSTLRALENYYYFTADGQFYDGVPPGGLERFDWDTAREETPQKVGSYVLEGDRLQVTMADGKSWEMTFGRGQGTDIRLDGHKAHLRGPYRASHAIGRYYNGVGQPGKPDFDPKAERVLRLNEYGEFEASRLEVWRATGVGEKTGWGTYLISGNTLMLTGDDGSVSYHTVVSSGEEDENFLTPATLNIDGRAYGLLPY